VSRTAIVTRRASIVTLVNSRFPLGNVENFVCALDVTFADDQSY